MLIFIRLTFLLLRSHKVLCSTSSNGSIPHVASFSLSIEVVRQDCIRAYVAALKSALTSAVMNVLFKSALTSAVLNVLFKSASTSAVLNVLFTSALTSTVMNVLVRLKVCSNERSF